MLFKDFVQINPKVGLKKGETYPYVGMADVNPSRGYVTNSETREYKNSRSKFKEGDTLFARITPCLENGKITRFKSDGIKKGFGSTEFFVFRAKEGISDSDYIYYLSRSPLIRKTAEKSMAGASGRQRADITAVEEVEIDPLDLPTQQKIASILSAFDDLIENNTRRIAILEEMVRRIYREWFVRFRYPGYENDALVDSCTELGEVPEGWEVKKLKDFLKFKNGKSPETKEGEEYPVYGSNGIIGKCNEPGWEDGIIIGRVGAYCGSVKYCEGKFWGSDNTIVATTREEYDFPLFVYYKLEGLNLRRYASGSAQPLMTQTVIKDIKVAIPSNEFLEQFSKQARDLWRLKRNLEKQNKKLKETRDLLLPKLISGKIDVEEITVN